MGSRGLAVALTLRGGQHCGPVGRRAGVAAAKISTALGTLADTDEGARREPGDSGGYGRAHATAMLAERQRQALQANIAEVRDPGRCYADDRLRTPGGASCFRKTEL